MSVWLERELIANLGVRAGFVHRAELQRRGTINTNQPFDAFNVTTTVRDPGPDGIANNADDGPSIPAFNLAAAYVGLPTQSLVTNVPGESTFDTWEIAMNKRMSNRWSASASYSFTSSHTYRTASNTYPVNPNSCINANDECQDDTSDYSFKLTGSFDLPAGIRLSPVYRFQAGTNFARTFVATLNYANPTLNAEPMNTQPDGARQPDRHPDRPSHHDRRQPAGAVLRSLQPHQQQRGAEHHGELGRVVAASAQHRLAAGDAHRREVRLVTGV